MLKSIVSLIESLVRKPNMKSLGFVSILLMIPLLPAAASERVEIPLPELVGSYGGGCTVYRHMDLTIRPIPAAIDSVEFRMSGYLEAGIYDCQWGPDCWPLIVSCMISDPEVGWWDWFFYGPCTSGETTVTSLFEESSFHQPGWDFLLDGECRLSFSVSPDWADGCVALSDDPTAEIQEAVIIIHMDPLVPAEGLTWGRVKSLYR